MPQDLQVKITNPRASEHGVLGDGHLKEVKLKADMRSLKWVLNQPD